MSASGCNTSAFRVFEKEVPKPITKPDKQIEAERRSADLLARFFQEPKVLRPVALSLSESLGAPKEPIPAATIEDLPKAADTSINELKASVVAMQRQLEQLNKTLATYQGKTIEGTGFSLLGPGMAAIVIGLIVLGVVFPPAFTLMLFAYRRLKATAGIIVEQVEEASKSPEAKKAVDEIKTAISRKMDRQHKNVVLNLKKA